MANYFENFKILQYSNSFCRSIISRSTLTKEALKTTTTFYPYEAKEGDRPDIVSHLYYGKPSSEWLLFFANDIIDPYFDFYLSQEQLTQHINSKYNGLARAQSYIRHYEVNWLADDSRKTVAQYNALTSSSSVNLKQYWQPVVDSLDRVIYYVRKPMDTTLNTNKVISCQTLSLNVASNYISDEIVYQVNSGIVSARGEIMNIDGNTIYIKNIQGNFVNSLPLIGQESDYSTSITNISVVVENIPLQEMAYWSPVSFYDYEFNENEKRKSMQVVDRNYLDVAENNLKKLMK